MLVPTVQSLVGRVWMSCRGTKTGNECTHSAHLLLVRRHYKKWVFHYKVFSFANPPRLRFRPFHYGHFHPCSEWSSWSPSQSHVTKLCSLCPLQSFWVVCFWYIILYNQMQYCPVSPTWLNEKFQSELISTPRSNVPSIYILYTHSQQLHCCWINVMSYPAPFIFLLIILLIYL